MTKRDRQTDRDRKLLIQLLVSRDDDSNKNSNGNSGSCHNYITHSNGNTSSKNITSPDDNTPVQLNRFIPENLLFGSSVS